MKRALAERAKQSGLPNGVGPSVPSMEPNNNNNNSSSSSPPLTSSPPDLPRTDAKPEHENNKGPLYIAKSSSNGGLSSSSVSSPRPSPRPKKRLRESSSVAKQLEEEDVEDSNSSAFYLRHQNRALASELRQLKYQIHRLERERDVRRSQCSLAAQSVHTLQATWTQLESALQQQHHGPAAPAGSSSDVTTMNAAHPTVLGSSSASAAPLSTGSGTSVELVGALLKSLAALGNTSSPKRRRIKSETGDDTMDIDNVSCSSSSSSSSDGDPEEILSSEPVPPPEGMQEDSYDLAYQQQQEDLFRISDNVAKRASTLQGWIWSLLHRCETNGSTQESSSPSAVAQEAHAAKQQVARLKAKMKTLKAQMKELTRTRDELQESDKRVRRGLYRLAAGRVQLKEVLKAIVASDEEKEAAAEWIGTATSAPLVATGNDAKAAPNAEAASSSSKVKTEEGAGADGKESSSVHSAKVAQLQKRVSDLEQIASARDETIKSVRTLLLVWVDGTRVFE